MPETTREVRLADTAWRELAAGRALDAIVAEYVEGFHREGQPADYHGRFAGEPVLLPRGETWESIPSAILPPKGQLALTFFVQERYSTDAAAALRLLGRQPADVKWSVHNRAGGRFGCWICTNVGQPTERQTFEAGETIAHAIVLALLAAREAGETREP